MRTSGLGVSEGQHYVYPGVRGLLLLPSDYICEYFSTWSFLFISNLVFVFIFVTGVFITAVLRCYLTSGPLFCGRAGMF